MAEAASEPRPVSATENKAEEKPASATAEKPVADKKPEERPASAADKKASENGGHSLKELFETYAKFGDPKSDGKSITLSNSDKWFKQAKVFDKKLTTVDTGICFKKLK